MHRRDVEGPESLIHAGHVRAILHKPQLARRHLPCAIGRHQGALANHHLRPCRHARVVHQVARGRRQHALRRVNLHRNTCPPGQTRLALPDHHVIGQLARLQRVDRCLDHMAVDHGHNAAGRNILAVGQIHAGRNQILALGRAVVVPNVEQVVV